MLHAILGYMILINFIGFISMGMDKYRAVKKKWRVKEGTLFFIAGIGGSFGSILGMHIFHHKSSRKKFRLGFFVLLLIQVLVLAVVYYGYLTMLS